VNNRLRRSQVEESQHHLMEEDKAERKAALKKQKRLEAIESMRKTRKVHEGMTAGGDRS
jgi:hypothetical protein